jgi:hypothetical protein
MKNFFFAIATLCVAKKDSKALAGYKNSFLREKLSRKSFVPLLSFWCRFFLVASFLFRFLKERKKKEKKSFAALLFFHIEGFR